MNNYNHKNNKQNKNKIPKNNYVFVEEKDGKQFYVDTIPKRWGVCLIAIKTSNGNFQVINGDKPDFLPEKYKKIIKKARQEYNESKK